MSPGLVLRVTKGATPTAQGLREEKRRLPLQHRAHRRTARCGARSGARLAMVIKTDLCSYTEYRTETQHVKMELAEVDHAWCILHQIRMQGFRNLKS